MLFYPEFDAIQLVKYNRIVFRRRNCPSEDCLLFLVEAIEDVLEKGFFPLSRTTAQCQGSRRQIKFTEKRINF